MDGVPVASGAAFLARDAVGVYGVGVHPAWQRRGYGSALTWRAIEAGVEIGHDRAILGATAAGKPVYEKIGFREVGRLRGFASG